MTGKEQNHTRHLGGEEHIGSIGLRAVLAQSDPAYIVNSQVYAIETMRIPMEAF